MRLRVVLVAVVASGALALPGASVAATPEPSSRIERLVTLGATRFAAASTASTAGQPPASTSDTRPDALGDVLGTDGMQTVEPRADISRVDVRYRTDLLEIAVTVPGGVDPATSPNYRGNLSGVVALFDVNGDDLPDFGSVLAADENGRVEVVTITMPPTPDPTVAAGALQTCPGTGGFDGGTRQYRLAIPASCIGNAYEVRAAAGLFFNRATSISDDFDLTLDLAPDGLDLLGVHRDTTRNGGGYRFVAGDGGIFTFGNAGFHGSTGDIRLNQPIVGMDSTRSGAGYWLVASDGGIFTFGDAPFLGSTGDIRLNQPINAMATTPTGAGYWLFARDGGVFSFGDAGFFGTPAASGSRSVEIVGAAVTPTGRGYWLASATGAVFAYGDARSLSSAAGVTSARLVGIAATPSGRGYWLAYEDGTVSARGDAAYLGDATDLQLNAPIVGLASTPTGRGYWLLGRDGGVFSYGDAAFHGSTGNLRLNQPVLDLAL